jgi:4-carboxymuconolactone decarboxylase
MTPTLPPSQRAARPFPESGLDERIGLPEPMDPAQQAAAHALINGPRQGVYGPFRALLHRPPLLHAVAKVGESLRFEGTLDAALREWTICVVAREQSNVFEWDMHHPLALASGISAGALHALDAGLPMPSDLRPDLSIARLLVTECLRDHRLGASTYQQASLHWSAATLVELITLVGYFAMINTLMNVARAPGPK